MFQGKSGGYSPNQTGKTNVVPTQSTTQTDRTGATTVIPLTPEELQKKLPITAPDFTIGYSDRMQKYVVTLGNDEAVNSYDGWLSQNPSYGTELQNALVTKQTIDEFHAALDYAKKNQLTPEKKAEQDAKEFTKNLNLLINLPFMFTQSLQTSGETPSPVPTSVPIPLPSERSIEISIPTKLLSPTMTSTVPSNLLPNPLAPIASQALNFKQSITSCLINRSIYDAASSQTGVPWEMLAAIHYIEGACGTNKSLVSGRTIGTNEPDIVRGGGCSSKISRPGIPVPLPAGGCGFYSLLDSAIYAGNHIKGKIGKIPENFQELAKAFSRYNGGGNSNCGSTPYPYCPELFEGEDDTYVVNMLDKKHETMYLVYCADLTKCNPPKIYSRPGAATVIRLITNQL